MNKTSDFQSPNRFQMKRISTNLKALLDANGGDPQEIHFDAIVVGSGYGGGVSALRLAETGRTVLVLERGRELLPGEYPNTPQSALKEMQVATANSGPLMPKSNGLYDVRVHEDMSVVVGCGLGGTSLINANVALDPDPRVFKDKRWPHALQRDDELSKYFKTAMEVLGSKPLPSRYHPNKLKALEASAEAFGNKVERPPLNVSFSDVYHEETKIFQPACNMCGDCCSGCNYGSKNTTLMNYLPLAHAKGASIVTEARVEYVEKSVDGRWLVEIGDLSRLAETPSKPASSDGEATDQSEIEIQKIKLSADIVVLAAGALGSTEILLRSRAKGLKTSDKLGQCFSGNGDVIGFGFDAFWNNAQNDAKDPQLPIYGMGAGDNRPDVPEYQPGPTITGVIKIDMSEPTLTDGMVIQEGVAPGAVSLITSLGLFVQQALNGDFTRFPDVEQRIRAAEQVGNFLLQGDGDKSLADLPYEGTPAQIQTFLAMSHDKADGELELRNDRIVVNWPDVGEQENYHRVNKNLELASDSIWANYIPNPLWRPRFGRKLVTVHPIGGCPMGNSGEDGVVDHACRVFAGNNLVIHEGLYVCDGAVIPSSLGLNPLLTITAISERAMEKLVELQPFAHSKHKVATPDIAPIPNKSTNTAVTAGLLVRWIKRLKDWQDLADRKDYSALRSEIVKQVKNFSGSSGAEPRGLQKLSDEFSSVIIKTSLTDAELSADIIPSLSEVSRLLEGISQFLAKEDADGNQAPDYFGAASFLEQEFGDYSPGLFFSETMRGHVNSPEERTVKNTMNALTSRHEAAASLGKALGQEFVATFEITAASIKEFTEKPEHQAMLSGKISARLPDGGDRREFEIVEGTFNLLIEDKSEVETWRMVYKCVCVEEASQNNCFLKGVKTLARKPGSNWWADLTTLDIDFYEGDDERGKHLATGMLTLGLQDLLSQLTTFRPDVSGAEAINLRSLVGTAVLFGDVNRSIHDPKQRQLILRNLLMSQVFKDNPSISNGIFQYFMFKFGNFFALILFQAYGEILAYLFNFPGRANLEGKVTALPDISGAKTRNLGVFSTSHWLPSEQERLIHLTRYDGRTNKFSKDKTVVLAPGFASRAASFAMETVEQNLVESLCEAGYDVWLLDYRSSPLLASSLKPFDLDDIAKEDWPMAVEHILKTADVRSIQAVVHCMGSMTHLMALLDGMKGIRSVVSSQLSLHPVTNWLNKFKADTYFAKLLREGLPSNLLPLADVAAPNKETANLLRGLTTINANSVVIENKDEKAKYVQDQVINLVTWNVPFPNDAPCYSPTCHRLFGIYGPIFAHEQLNEDTHNAIQTVFGEVSTAPFKHIAEVIRQGLAVDSKGQNSYLKNYQNLRIPITFLAGALNQEFMPDTSLRTLRWLENVNKDWLDRVGHHPEKNPFYERLVEQEYAHMDYFLGKNAHKEIYPKIISELQRHDKLLSGTV